MSRLGQLLARARAGPLPHGPADRLVAAAQRRLAITTLVVLVALLVVVGATTALLAQQTLDASVDRTLETAALAELERLREAAGQGSTQQETEPPGSGATASAVVVADPDDHAPAAADTFFLSLDAAGDVIANPERVPLAGLPDRAAAAAAASQGRDLRTIRAGVVPVRLLTIAVPAGEAGQLRTLQAGFVLTLHDEQSDTLLRAILVVALGSLLGAAGVTVLLTRRALAPVRDAFDRERRFVAAASHELRTPIALIRGTAEVLQREEPGGDELDALAGDIVAESDRLAGLVTDLSDLALAEARPPAPATAVDLVALAADVVHRAEPMARAAGQKLVTDEPPWTAAVGSQRRIAAHADRTRVVQVALILIDNAVRHTPAGGTVRIEARSVDRHRVELAVSDQGPGIPPDHRERVFEPFARLSRPDRRGDAERGTHDEAGGTGGSGLGLAIARALVTAMHGEIRVEDAPGGGARFVVALPSA